jgi:predicted MFS family arabinose efflux permease
MEQTLNPPRQSAIALTALAYLPSVLSMMTIGVIVPFISPLSQDLRTTPAQLGLAIALFSVPSAILATLGGGLIDAYGVRRSMLFAAAFSAIGSALASQAGSALALDGSMLVSGLGFGAMCVAAPCLIMATLSDGARIRSMSLLSTFAPTGYAAGLLLAVVFADTGNWHAAMLAHAALSAAAFAAILLFAPKVSSRVTEGRESLQQTFKRMLGIFRVPGAVRLGIAVALPNAVSYGTSLAVPSYLAHAHHLSIATSSASVASAKLAALIIGGVGMGYLLSRQVRARTLFAVMVVIGVVAQSILFLTTGSIMLATAALVLWLFAFGGMSGGAMTLLPVVVRDPARRGAASGLVNQCISLASFCAPSTWLALNDGMQFVLLAAGCLVVSLLALPTPAAAGQ